MAEKLCTLRKHGGGTELNIQYDGYVLSKNNVAKTFTVDSNKSYVLFSCLLYTTNSDRVNVYSIENGTLSHIHQSEAQSYVNVSLNGTTLTCICSDTSYTEFVLVSVT